MIKINRSPKPDINPQFNCLDGNNRKTIVETLKKDTNDCCSFCCENDISAGSGDIEHFRPKANFLSKHCDWSNLFWSCRNCNNTKSNQFYSQNTTCFINNKKALHFFFKKPYFYFFQP